MKDHWKGKRTKARIKVAKAIQKLFKNKKAPVNNEIEFSTEVPMEDAPTAKKMRTWSAKTIAKRDAARAQKARDRGIIKQENADPANVEWMKNVTKDMRG